jgi:hypothetical protein
VVTKNLKKIKMAINLNKIINEKHIYELLSCAFIVILNITAMKYLETKWFLTLLIPNSFILAIALIMFPIMLKKEPTKFKDIVNTYYLILSFWFIYSIIFMVWKW